MIKSQLPILTFTTLCANSADNKLMTFLFYFSQKTGFDVFWEKYFKMLSVEVFTRVLISVDIP